MPLKPYVLRLLVAGSCLLISITASAFDELKVGFQLADIRSGKIDVKTLVSSLQQRIEFHTGERVTIRPVILRSARDSLAGLLDGRVDVTRLDSAHYLESKTRYPEITLVALEDRNSAAQESVICVNEKEKIKSIADLDGKSFAFGAENTAAGHFLVQQRLVRAGVRAHDLAEYRYIPQQRKIGLGVASGVFDAGVIDRQTYDRLVAEGRPIRSIGELDEVKAPWVSRPFLSARLQSILHTVLPGLEFDQFRLHDGSENALQAVRSAIDDNRRFYN